MSRSAIIVLRILAVGSALTILACQIVNRQQLAAGAAAGDRGASGVQAEKKTWAAGSKSARMLSPEELNEPALAPLLPPPGAPPAAVPSETVAPAQPAPPPASSPPPVQPAPARVRGFGSKSAPPITPADLRQMRQQTQQSAQQKNQ